MSRNCLLLVLVGLAFAGSALAQSVVSGRILDVFRWTAPVLPDGSVETGHAGFRLYYGTLGGAWTNVIFLERESAACAFSGLQSGQYFFFITAVASDGLEGDLSPVVWTRVR
jgi:hypothetical protein